MYAEKSLLREYLEALLIAVIFATFARTWIVQAFKIPSGSMEKNLLIGDHILVNKFIYGPTVSPLEETLLPVRKVRRGGRGGVQVSPRTPAATSSSGAWACRGTP